MLTAEQLAAAVDAAIRDLKKPHEMHAAITGILGRALVQESRATDARLKALEQRRSLSFAGPYDVARGYRQDDLVQRGGALYLALVDVKAGDLPAASASWRRLADSKGA